MGKNKNKLKATLLGMPHGTAAGRLRKMLLFKCVQELGKNICFRCGEVIEDERTLSIEHITSWQLSETPKETFFDLDNIAFSHLKCNVGAAPRPTSRCRSAIGETGYRGVKIGDNNKNPYRAVIMKNGETLHLGYFATPEEASAAYEQAAKNLDGSVS